MCVIANRKMRDVRDGAAVSDALVARIKFDIDELERQVRRLRDKTSSQTPSILRGNASAPADDSDSGPAAAPDGGVWQELKQRLDRVESLLRGVESGDDVLEVSDMVARHAWQRYRDLLFDNEQPPKVRAESLEMLRRFPSRFGFAHDAELHGLMLGVAASPADERALGPLCDRIIAVVSQTDGLHRGEALLMEIVQQPWDGGRRLRALLAMRKYRASPEVQSFVAGIPSWASEPVILEAARIWPELPKRSEK